MTKFRFTLNILATVAFMIALATMAQAQATRTWVSGVGDDANPCSRTAPCKTFAGAISKTATGGEIDALDDAGYGAVTITKSITIDGSGHLAGILAAGTTGVIVNATATSIVQLRNLSINGATTGIFGVRVLAAGQVSIERCFITGFTNHGVHINLANGALCNVYIKDTTISTGNTTTSRGVNIQPVSGSAGVIMVLDRVRLERMSVGIFVGPGAVITMSNSQVYHNITGIQIDGTGSQAQATVSNSIISHNGVGILAGTNGTARISGDTLNNNSGKGLQVSGGSIVSSGNNSVYGNAADDAPTSTPPQI